MKNSSKGRLIKGGAVAIDVAVPLVATLTQFPVWTQKSAEATVSGLFVFLAAICALPFLKQIREYMKSPSVIVVWAILFVVFTVLQHIISQMLVVCFAGLVANIVGAGIYKFGEFVAARPDKIKGDTDRGYREN